MFITVQADTRLIPWHTLPLRRGQQRHMRLNRTPAHRMVHQAAAESTAVATKSHTEKP